MKEKHLGRYGMTKKVLVTGGNGFIGSHLLVSLLKKDFLPIVYLRKSSRLSRINEILDHIIVYENDISLEEIFKKEELNAVINLASYYRKMHTADDINLLIDANISFPTKILDLCEHYNVNKFVTAGTYFQYTNSFYHQSEAVYIPRDLYASTKSAMDKIMDYYNNNTDVKAMNLVLFTPYGPKDHSEKLIPYLISNGIKKKAVRLSKGFQKINPVYVKDIAEAFVKALRIDLAQDSGVNHLNIASNKSYSIREIVSIIEELLGYNFEKQWNSVESEKIDIDYYLDIDTSKTEKLLGWKAKTDIYKGLSDTIKYYLGDSVES
ncbi:MAG: NAD(P)-dependent oxidoreductase [Thermoplasmatales archaeon]